MKYANKVEEFINAFEPGPLSIDELDQFYYDKTMEVRTGDAYDSPITDIYEASKRPEGNRKFLLLGHRGCGKSTELNKMSETLMEEGYKVATIQCGLDMDTNNPAFSDLLILMGDALLQMAYEEHCHLDKSVENTIIEFWDIKETTTTTDDDSDLDIEGGISVETPSIIAKLLKLSGSVKGSLKYSENRRTVYRERITQRLSEWKMAMNSIADEITKKLHGKQPILIFEDLDKLEAGDAWEIFQNHAVALTAVSFPLIYTFPIALSYDPKFRSLTGYFETKTFPMIKLQEANGNKFEAGYDTIKAIVEKRARLDLFSENVLENLIAKTGGSLRDLFKAINASATRARRRNSEVIESSDTSRALESIKSDLTRVIERKHYSFLVDIANGNHEMIDDKEMLLEMLQAGAVLEYNGKRWHNVHPLVRQFLEDQGLIKKIVI